MAITATAQITGQSISSTGSYAYLYEPLKANITESISTATVIYIDMAVYHTDQDDTQYEYLNEYAVYDYSDGITLEVDFMDIIQQYHDSNIYKIGTTADISSATDIPVSKFRYKFYIYSDVTSVGTEQLFVTPLIGGRNFYDFTAAVSQTQVLTEAALNSVTLSGRWLNYPNISVTLADPTSTDDCSPTITISTETSAELEPCGGMLIWKSRFGGWMYWGMDIAERTPKSSYTGNLEVGLFEATDSGNPYVQTDYTRIDSSYSTTLKAIALTNEELESVSGIADSVAIYYMRNSTAKLELMRLTSMTAPISTLIGGGNFSVGLESISTSSQKAR